MTQQIEIECKYQIASHEVPALRKILRKQCIKHHCIEKHDTYYLLIVNDDKKLIRLRRTKNACVLTYKKNKLHPHGIEENIEYEVKIDNEKAMHAMLNALGATLYIKKHKISESFTLPHYLYGNTVIVELVKVPPLGYFFEIECIANKNEKNLKSFYNTISRTAKAYNLSQDTLKKHPYIDMLKTHKNIKNVSTTEKATHT